MDGFAAVLRSLREARSPTQEELAERAGLTVKAVGALERGERRRPYPHTVRALADALDTDEHDRAALVAAVPPRARTATEAPRSSEPAAAAPRPGGLRPPPGPVFGRDGDVDRVAALVRDRGRPIVSLTGLGGVGKTTLALVVADRVRLDGIPLAVELAASASAMLGPAALLDRLDALPETGPRDLPDRQRTMTVCLDRSHRLLGAAAQDVLARLSVFAAGSRWPAPRPSRAWRRSPGRELLDHAFVVRGDDVHGSERFRLLEPVRRHAGQRLTDDGRADAAERHTRHVRSVARDLAPDLRGPHLRPALDLLAADHDDLRAVARRLAEQGREDELGDLLGDVWPYLALRGHAREGLGWADRPASGARHLVAVAGLFYVVGAIPAVRDAGEAAVALCRDRDDPALLGEALVLAGSGALFSGDLDRARALLEDGAAAGVPRWAGAHLVLARGQVALLAGDLVDADRLLREAEGGGRAVGNAFTLATALNARATGVTGADVVVALDGAHRGLLGTGWDRTVPTVAPPGRPPRPRWPHTTPAPGGLSGPRSAPPGPRRSA